MDQYLNIYLFLYKKKSNRKDAEATIWLVVVDGTHSIFENERRGEANGLEQSLWTNCCVIFLCYEEKGGFWVVAMPWNPLPMEDGCVRG